MSGSKRKKLSKEIDKLVEEIAASDTSSGGFECKGLSFVCVEEYNCVETHSCQTAYTNNAGREMADTVEQNRKLKARIDELSEEVKKMLDDAILKNLSPEMSVQSAADCPDGGYICDPASYSCTPGEFDCVGVFGCAQKFSG